MVAPVLALHKEKKELLWWTVQSLRWTVAGSSRRLSWGHPHSLVPAVPELGAPMWALGLQGLQFIACRIYSPFPFFSSFPSKLLLCTRPMHWTLTLTRVPVRWLGTGSFPCSPDRSGLRLGYYFSPPIIYTKIFVGCSVAEKSVFFQKRTRERKKPIRSFS